MQSAKFKAIAQNLKFKYISIHWLVV